MTDCTTYYASPIGSLTISSDGNVITGILYPDAGHSGEQYSVSSGSELPEVVQQCIRQLDEYFAGKRRGFNVPVAQKGTSFQQSVWKGLNDISYGATWSYLNLARHIGNEKSIRAVGTANSKNQISIIVPCHRVIGANGNLTGYAGDLWRKKWLLEHEQHVAHGVQFLF